MDVIGIDTVKQMEILQLVAAIMHIGNITFVENNNFAAVADEHCKYCHGMFCKLLIISFFSVIINLKIFLTLKL